MFRRREKLGSVKHTLDRDGARMPGIFLKAARLPVVTLHDTHPSPSPPPRHHPEPHFSYLRIRDGSRPDNRQAFLQLAFLKSKHDPPPP